MVAGGVGVGEKRREGFGDYGQAGRAKGKRGAFRPGAVWPCSKGALKKLLVRSYEKKEGGKIVLSVSGVSQCRETFGCFKLRSQKNALT